MTDGVNSEVSLKRALGLFTSTLLVVGIVIGSGVFKKIVPMAQTGLGEIGILMAWLSAGVITLFGALTVGGLATLTDKSGGVYEYLNIAFGKRLSFLAGWADFMIIGSGPIAALSFLFAQIIHNIIPIPNPLQALETISIANFIFPFADSGIKLVGIATIVILTGVNILGVRESGVINNIVTGAKILGILILIVLGLTYSGPVVGEHIVAGTAGLGEGIMYMSAFLSAMVGAFWAYDGWATAPNISGEIINPKRNVPLALAYGMVIVVALYTLANYVYMLVLPIQTLRAVGANEIAGLLVAETVLGGYGRVLFLVLIVICVFGATNTNIIIVPRKYFRMAEEGYFFKNAKGIHRKFNTPYVAMLYTMIWSCVLLISGSFDMLTDMVIFASFLFFGLLAIALIKLKRNGTIKAKVIGYPIVPVVFLLFSVALSVNTIWVQPKESLLGMLLILTGVPIYYYFRNQNVAPKGGQQ